MLSRRVVWILIPGGLVALGVIWLAKPEKGSGFIVGGKTVSYDYYDTTTPPKGWKAAARMEFTFTNFTTQSIWLARQLQFDSATKSEPAHVTEFRKSLGQYTHEKLSGFPQGLKSSWDFWASPPFSLTSFASAPLEEVRPNETVKFRVSGVIGRTQRIGVICQAQTDSGGPAKWTTNWSDVFTPTR